MANNKDIKKNKPKKEKKKRKPIYEIQGFVLTIPEERLKEMLLEMSKPNPEKSNYIYLTNMYDNSLNFIYYLCVQNY